jgi:hypothetical protein
MINQRHFLESNCAVWYRVLQGLQQFGISSSSSEIYRKHIQLSGVTNFTHSRSPNQDIPHILWKPVVHYHAHKNATMIQMNQAHILTPISSRPLLTLPSHPHLDIPSDLFISAFPTVLEFLAFNIQMLKNTSIA